LGDFQGPEIKKTHVMTMKSGLKANSRLGKGWGATRKVERIAMVLRPAPGAALRAKGRLNKNSSLNQRANAQINKINKPETIVTKKSSQ
jgi:hypothetical protein